MHGVVPGGTRSEQVVDGRVRIVIMVTRRARRRLIVRRVPSVRVDISAGVAEYTELRRITLQTTPRHGPL